MSYKILNVLIGCRIKFSRNIQSANSKTENCRILRQKFVDLECGLQNMIKNSIITVIIVEIK